MAGYIFAWNPDWREWNDLGEMSRQVQSGQQVVMSWTLLDLQAKAGDLAFLVRDGSESGGIFASGTLLGEPHLHNTNGGQGGYRVDIRLDALVDPQVGPVFTWEPLKARSADSPPSIPPDAGHLIDDEQANNLYVEWMTFYHLKMQLGASPPDNTKLVRYQQYSRSSVRDIFQSATGEGPSAADWEAEEILPVPDHPGDLVFFVTLGQANGERGFQEGLSSSGELTWQPKPSRSLQGHQFRQLINHNEFLNSIFLFFRNADGDPFTYLGRLKYLSHARDREYHVYFEWQVLEWDASALPVGIQFKSEEKNGTRSSFPIQFPKNEPKIKVKTGLKTNLLNTLRSIPGVIRSRRHKAELGTGAESWPKPLQKKYPQTGSGRGNFLMQHWMAFSLTLLTGILMGGLAMFFYFKPHPAPAEVPVVLPTASPTLQPTMAPTLAPTAAPTPTLSLPTPIFTDPFVTADPLVWNLPDQAYFGPTVDASITGGKLRLAINCPASSQYSYCVPIVNLLKPELKDFDMTFDLTIEEQSDNANTGLDFRFRENPMAVYYAFHFNNAGKFWFNLYAPEQTPLIVQPRTLPDIPETRKPIAFRIRAVNNDFSILENGQLILTAADDHLNLPGTFSIYYYVSQGGSATISLQNFVVNGVP